MFYQPKDGHPLPHNPFNAIVSPRPIGWISTRDGEGRNNLAPYSFFNAVSYVPPQVMFASTSAKDDQDNTKDSVANIRETGVFCVNIVEAAMRNEMNATSAPLGKDEDECNYVVFCFFIGVHMRDNTIVNGRFDVSTFQPLSRLGYRDYSVVENVFELDRPDD